MTGEGLRSDNRSIVAWMPIFIRRKYVLLSIHSTNCHDGVFSWSIKIQCWLKFFFCTDWMSMQAQIQRAGTGGPDPLRFVGSCVEAWWVGEEVQQLFYLFISNFLCIIQHITCIHASKFNVQYGTSNFPLLALMKGHFHIFLSRITRFYTI